jgi:Do/DeqQ family serine protease
MRYRKRAGLVRAWAKVAVVAKWLANLATSALPALAAFLALALPANAQRAVPESAVTMKQSFAPVVKRAAPAVVNVYVRHRVEQMVSPFFNDPFFGRLFGERFGIPRERIENSLGSGVLVSADGVVVTNNHVIQGSGEADITVALSDGREFPAKTILKDEQTDLAVLRVEAGSVKFPYIGFNDSDSLEVGDIVLAIGDPFGVGQTVTSGIVSALARTQVGISDYQFFIQTDAAINPGNSGGALVDMDGLLVGINTAIFSKSGGSHGIGFAIPSNMVRLVVESALKGGKVQRPWLGAALQKLTPDIADSLGLEAPSGALIAKVHAKGPAAKAGLRAGDVVVSVDEKPVLNPAGFEYRFVTKGIGGSAELGVVRKGQKLKANIVLVAPVEDPPRDARGLTGRHPLAGCKVANLSPAVAQEVGMNDDTRQGVVVLEVEQQTPAARLGVRRGDIVVAVNDEKVTSVAQLDQVLAGSGGGWRLAVERDGKLFNIAIQG